MELWFTLTKADQSGGRIRSQYNMVWGENESLRSVHCHLWVMSSSQPSTRSTPWSISTLCQATIIHPKIRFATVGSKYIYIYIRRCLPGCLGPMPHASPQPLPPAWVTPSWNDSFERLPPSHHLVITSSSKHFLMNILTALSKVIQPPHRNQTYTVRELIKVDNKTKRVIPERTQELT